MTKPKKLELILLGLILLLAAFFRLYRISDYMTFLGDEGRDALVVRDIVQGKKFPLIGPGTSVGNMYLGPLYYYLISPALLLSGLSPVGPSILVSLIGVATVGMLWWIGREWFGEKAALAVSLLYATAPVVIVYSRSSWNPNVMPFFSLLCIWGIWQVWKKSKYIWLPIVAISFAFVLNSHYLGLLLTPPLLLFYLFAPKTGNFKLISFVSVAAFLLLMSPLLLFDMRHNWPNFNSLKTFLTVRETTVNLKAYKALPNIWPVWGNFTTQTLGAQKTVYGDIISIGLVLILFGLLVRIFKTGKLESQLVLTLTWLLFGLIGMALYKQHVYAHYFGFMFPLPFLLIGFAWKHLAYKISLKVLLGVIVVSLLAVNLINHPFRSEPNRQLTRTETIARFIASETGSTPFNLALLSRTNYDAGYRYFLTQLGAPVHKLEDRKTDYLYVICEPGDCQPVGHPLYEIAAFGWVEIDQVWDFPWNVKVYRLVRVTPTV